MAVDAPPRRRRSAPPTPHASYEERVAAGRAARKQVARASLGAWSPDARRPDPVLVLMRQGDLTTITVNNPNVRLLPVGRPFATAVVYPTWVEGDAYFALKWTPHLVASVGWEFSTRPSPKLNENFFNGALQYNITTASSIRVFVGGTRGGLKCISGICRDFPPFTGARLEVVVRL